MRLFLFKSESNNNLRAYAADIAGTLLPSQFRPWRAVGAIAAGAPLPFKMEREPIERAITDDGYQLFRFKAAVPSK